MTPAYRSLSVIITIIATILMTMGGSALADIPLETSPVWTSTAGGQVATGGGWADLDGDGWLDMVVANGNDIQRQRIYVYRGNGDGSLPLSPTWTSTDIDYHGHLDLGDIDGDGLVDLAVAVYIGPAGFSQPGKVKVYLGNGVGGFSSTPDWQSADDFYCFSLALGDADGDGDLDLACTAGESYNHIQEHSRLFYNLDGTLETSPSWVADEIGYSLDATWDDIDLDGDLDLIFGGILGANRLYLNRQTEGLGLPTTAHWESTDPGSYANTIACGDWNGDGYPELAVADNYQEGGAGRFKVYGNDGGELNLTPGWQSSSGGYGSNVVWSDVDLDGDLDLAGGRWWGAVRIYENSGGLGSTPAWSSSTNSVIENMFWGDVDNDGLRSDGHATAWGDGARTLVKLGRSPVRSVDEVRVAGMVLDPGEYCLHPERGWISLAAPPAVGEEIGVDFTFSQDLDLGVTNWDSNKGNYLFRNTGSPVSVHESAALPGLFLARPNPVVSRTVIRYQGEGADRATLAIYDVRGRRVRELFSGPLGGGLHTWEWDGSGERGGRVAGGIYFARFHAGGTQQVVKLVLL